MFFFFQSIRKCYCSQVIVDTVKGLIAGGYSQDYIVRCVTVEYVSFIDDLG